MTEDAGDPIDSMPADQGRAVQVLFRDVAMLQRLTSRLDERTEALEGRTNDLGRRHDEMAARFGHRLERLEDRTARTLEVVVRGRKDIKALGLAVHELAQETRNQNQRTTESMGAISRTLTTLVDGFARGLAEHEDIRRQVSEVRDGPVHGQLVEVFRVLMQRTPNWLLWVVGLSLAFGLTAMGLNHLGMLN